MIELEQQHHEQKVSTVMKCHRSPSERDQKLHGVRLAEGSCAMTGGVLLHWE